MKPGSSQLTTVHHPRQLLSRNRLTSSELLPAQGTGDARYLGARLIPIRSDKPFEQVAQVCSRHPLRWPTLLCSCSIQQSLGASSCRPSRHVVLH